jgi:hypothetical protein
MLSHHCCGALFRRGMGLALALADAACTTAPLPASSVAAADPATRVPAAQYRSVLPASVTLAPAEPGPWRVLNQDAVPPSALPRGQEP